MKSSSAPKKHIKDYSTIRIIVNAGRGFGHQKASITLMQKLRQMGFTGVFDILYTDDDAGDKIKSLIFNSTPADSKDQVLDVSGLGKLTINAFPITFDEINHTRLSHTDLTVSAADDLVNAKKDYLKIYNTADYISLEPTDWHLGKRFVISESGLKADIDPECRLSSEATTKLEVVPQNDVEKRLLDLLQDKNSESQLLYGFYYRREEETNIPFLESTSAPNPTFITYLIAQSYNLTSNQEKPLIMLFPQDFVGDEEFQKNLRILLKDQNVHFIDLHKEELDMNNFGKSDVVIAYTGNLRSEMFDHCLLSTSLPAIVEGRGARELCESTGKPYIHFGIAAESLREYPLKSSHKSLQATHKGACLCLETRGEKSFFENLINYTERAINRDSSFLDYHKARREAFLTRPDICEAAFDLLGIDHNKSQDKPKPSISSHFWDVFKGYGKEGHGKSSS